MIKKDYDQNPFIVIWELTRACELQCLHCRAEAQYRRHPNELSFTEGKKLIDEIETMDRPMLVFSGGDPLMRGDVFELASYAVSRGIRVSMTPSATPNVTKEAMIKGQSAGLSRWAFSIDGPDEQIHDYFRGTAGSFKLTVDAIRTLHELNMPVQINTVISSFNVNELERMAALVSELKCVLWSVFFLVPTGRGEEKHMISPAEHERVLHWLFNHSKTAEYDIKTTAAQHYRRVVIQQKKRADASEKPIDYQDTLKTGMIGAVDGLGRAPKGVNDGNGFVFISHTGDIYPSGLLPVKGGNVRDDGLAEVYRHSPLFQALRDPSNYKGKCGVCEYRYVCGGSRSRAYALTGNYLESEPACVYIPEAYRARS
ncbi:TIGR04053 family radical SAM/SPASM domain-containing protein [Salisediminibacterium halotolerans]|uniref:TIGR04053 family radical SAM/SPASM domain-containing protein n=1 Tax=Salisediminibacterium halotolerans TaxID=517425 RepID=UPI000EADF455|nr:TIGR04053 family radical SAM/SPASM domain-containing protein [Salisediminibacterium halotolerans]RLJ74426.1 radical SAM protein [Actinophytocola xinjiangensis]RPE87481.1 radical SAM protein [Salisediminibacterium halotolerans]TWG35262.1 radical SAM protein [Salisediminibacterium halotolerans]GEL06743.1 radical SAM protein [Salisediminibacterium halotolerans]